MRGEDLHQAAMYSSINLDQRIPEAHRLRAIRKMVNQALEQLSNHLEGLYARRGRPSIPPEHLIRALLLQLLYGLRSEAQLMVQLEYNLLFRWFVGLEMSLALPAGKLLAGHAAKAAVEKLRWQTVGHDH